MAREVQDRLLEGPNAQAAPQQTSPRFSYTTSTKSADRIGWTWIASFV